MENKIEVTELGSVDVLVMGSGNFGQEGDKSTLYTQAS
ncbi:hypothetical protein Cyrtocomes_00682 [Candidatus Cyrtobacter comes]|uniref:Uncharacterized protein n=1 Tax=Candidatus Cyrtobacter comes TaxID=675776 RepID=A0ABU5L852_9RICK|nr:hypothetical protein [Candidatus Cyrtobacter comes]